MKNRLNHLLQLTICLLMFSNCCFAQTQNEKEYAIKLHHSIKTIDTHCDIPMKMHWYDPGVKHDYGYFDLPRMKEGGLSGEFFAVYIPQGPKTESGFKNAFEKAHSILNSIDSMLIKYSDDCKLGLSVGDFEENYSNGLSCVFIGLENGYAIGKNVDNVNYFYNRGVRYITLSHKSNNQICCSSTDNDKVDTGLTNFGEKVIKRMNDIGMIIDVSHISQKSFFDVLKLTKAPVIASHSCVAEIQRHRQNLTDKQLLAIKENNGVVHINFVRSHLKAETIVPELKKEMDEILNWMRKKGGYNSLSKKEKNQFTLETRRIKKKYPKATGSVKDIVNHIDYIKNLIGIDHIGIGSDFEGGGYLADCYTVQDLPNITIELVKRGYNDEEIKKIWSGNFLRVMKSVSDIESIN